MFQGYINPIIYRAWLAMRSRCRCKTDKRYRLYGGIGVSICRKWEDYLEFHDWAINNGWRKGLDLDKDIKGNGKLYSPETCMWVSRKENNRHTKRVKLSMDKANEIRLSDLANKDLAKIYNVGVWTIAAVKRNIIWV